MVIIAFRFFGSLIKENKSSDLFQKRITNKFYLLTGGLRKVRCIPQRRGLKHYRKEKLMDELQALMGDSYKEGLTVEDITNFMKGKKFADLSTGSYVDVNKYNNEIANLNKTINDKDNMIKAKDNELKSKMSDEDLVKAAQKEKDDEIERLKQLLSANTLSSNKSIANSSLTEGLNLIGIKDDDNELKTFVDNITTEDTDKTSSVAKYVNKLIKDAYEKGKKDSTKNAMGEFGKQKGDSTNGNKEIGALGKELAQKHVSNKTDFDYFKKD